eukprot:8091566-Pyramimonas_sp.AAC.1
MRSLPLGPQVKLSICAHEAREGCDERGRRRHANCAMGPLGGPPYGAPKRVRGVPKWGGAAMRTAPLGP